MKRYKKSYDYKYIVWFENEGKGSIKNYKYDSKSGAFGRAIKEAYENNKNVLIQKFNNICIVYPDGDHEPLIEGKDYKIMNSKKPKSRRSMWWDKNE